MRVLVLGGNGFIGSHILDALIQKGHKVRVFSRTQETYRLPLPEVEYIIGSFSDSPLLAEALEGVDAVFHLISSTVPSTSNIDPVGDIESNLINTVRLLQIMVKQDVKRIIYLSSGGTVYGIPEIVPIPENHPLKPICSYGVVKIAIENYLFMFQSLYGIKPTILRVSNPFGERQGHKGVQGVIGTFLYKAMVKEPIVIWGDGSIVRDFIYVNDLANLCARVLEIDTCGIFNVGSGDGISINKIIECIEDISGTKLTVNYKPHRSFDIPQVVLDISNTRNNFNWGPTTHFQQGVKKTWDWLKTTRL